MFHHQCLFNYLYFSSVMTVLDSFSQFSPTLSVECLFFLFSILLYFMIFTMPVNLVSHSSCGFYLIIKIANTSLILITPLAVLVDLNSGPTVVHTVILNTAHTVFYYPAQIITEYLIVK